MEFDADITNIDLNCPKTWKLIGEGNTRGCFQLESRLGRTIAKKLKPENIEQLSALISIIRPGSLEAMRDGKSVTNHYIDKKNGEEEIDYFHPSLESILGSTYGEMIYQEQAIKIAKELAGFNPQEADNLRKAIGKKKPEEMAKLKIKFMQGCKQLNIVSEKDAEQIFGWIEKSQRYSFNKSHGVSYAMNSYLSAYAKAHFPIEFFTASLQNARNKIDPHTEIKELYQNAIEMNIVVKKPDIRILNEFFELKNDIIHFGLTDIKGVGESAYKKLTEIIIEENIDLNTFKWIDFLFLLSKINSIAAKNLILAGTLDHLKISRNKMLFEYNTFCELTDKEASILKSIANNSKSLEYNLQQLYSGNYKISIKRKDIIANLIHFLNKPPYSLEDQIDWIVDNEHSLLGCAISYSKVDRYDTSMINYSCHDFKNNRTPTNTIMLVGEIENINITKIKNGNDKGNDMAFLTINDGSASLDSVICFSKEYKQYRNQLFVGNVIVISGKKSRQKDSFVVEKIYLPRT